jgi:oxepin-CoA hydrolase/3-oxo-5,6-dehydrosuberyl-CoA semialdehyde dehydrogenase
MSLEFAAIPNLGNLHPETNDISNMTSSTSPFLGHFIANRWHATTESTAVPLLDPVTGAVIAHAGPSDYDLADAYNYARQTGNANLRRLTFQERGRMLKQVALFLLSQKEEFYQISYATGATRADSWIDIEGGIGNLFAYASLRRKFPDTTFALDGEGVPMSKQGTFSAHHLLVPKEGVAVHINAFNFPVWGMLEKVAVNWLAGVPAIVKPATATSFLTEAVVRAIVASQILPPGAIQLICGPARNILDFVDERDVVTFTGSAATGQKLRAHPRINAHSVPFNLEADSLNSAILGTDVSVDSPEFGLFIKEVRKELTIKCGQKCTAIRRVFVPEHLMDPVAEELAKALDQTAIGDPRRDDVRMGAMVGKSQLEEVRQQADRIAAEAERIYRREPGWLEAGHEDAAFMAPEVYRANNPHAVSAPHEVEAFGPVCTLMPYQEVAEAVALSKRGKGSLCCSITSHDRKVVTEFVREAATMHGRILVLDRDCARESTGHGSPLPLLVHGGPGRAGGGEEMGGIRGVHHYMQRTAIQGSPTMIGAITEQFQPGGAQPESEPHVFRKHFEDLAIGDTVYTHKHTVTEADIVNFANVSGDNFYAHVDATSLEGTIFEGRVAHGYFVLSKAAGLFVDPRKGPVLLNYGIEEARFTKPVYPGMTIGVRLTVKEKIAQERRSEDDIAKGIVKFYVDVRDETDESVAIATILTMVKKKDQTEPVA